MDATNRLLDKTTQSFDHGAVDELCVNCAGWWCIRPPEEWFLKEPEANAEHVQRPQSDSVGEQEEGSGYKS